jgi:hypothetical protein
MEKKGAGGDRYCSGSAKAGTGLNTGLSEQDIINVSQFIS